MGETLSMGSLIYKNLKLNKNKKKKSSDAQRTATEIIRKPLNFVVLDARTEQTLRLSWPHRLKVRESFKIIGTCAQVPSYSAGEPI
jgi:hypothetical protein